MFGREVAGVLGTEADDGGVGLTPPWLDDIDCEAGGELWPAAVTHRSFAHSRSCFFKASKFEGYTWFSIQVIHRR